MCGAASSNSPAPFAACRAVAAAHRAGLLAACHDCSDGGLAVAVAEMAIAGRLGARLDLAAVPGEPDAVGHDLALAFGETPGRFVCAVRADHADAFAAAMGDVPWAWIGAVTAEPALEILTSGGDATSLAVDRLARAWRREEG
jgi:phosphoribosylformylglycinamidine synthase